MLNLNCCIIQEKGRAIENDLKIINFEGLGLFYYSNKDDPDENAKASARNRVKAGKAEKEEIYEKDKKRWNPGYVYVSLDYNHDNYPIVYAYHVLMFEEFADKYGLTIQELDDTIFDIVRSKEQIFQKFIKSAKGITEYGLTETQIYKILVRWARLTNRGLYDANIEKHVNDKGEIVPKDTCNSLIRGTPKSF